jgi:hypothetical protein
MIFDHYLRLEPRQPDFDFDRGIQAEIGDPLWFLGRQWQMGEHQGEDAGSPVRVSAWVARRPVDPVGGDPRWDPKVVPPEAIVEGEPGGWWTIGRRIRYGARFKPFVDVATLPIECFLCLPARDSRAYGTEVPAPYDQFNSQAGERIYLDGEALWQRPGHSGVPEASFPEIPTTEPADLWQPDELGYEAQFTCQGHNFKMQRHPGGHIDWYAVDSDAPFTTRQLPAGAPPEVSVFPAQLTYPGAPNTRYWQIENAQVDIGGYPPDQGHFPSMLLTDLLSSHGTQWFLFPVTTQAGHALTVERVVVTDGFGQIYSSEELADLRPPIDWSLFKVHGLDFNTLIVWPTALTPLSGALLEQVILGIDEYSNLLWAVERRVNSRDVRTPSFQERKGHPAQPPTGPVNAAEKEYRYLPAVDAVPYWHPYKLDLFGGQRRFIQSRLVEYSGATATLMDPVPAAHVLNDPRLTGMQPVHVIDPAAVPVNGLALERRWMLTRDVNGRPVLWIARQRKPLLAPPGRHLRFDVMEEVQP